MIVVEGGGCVYMARKVGKDDAIKALATLDRAVGMNPHQTLGE